MKINELLEAKHKDEIARLYLLFSFLQNSDIFEIDFDEGYEDLESSADFMGGLHDDDILTSKNQFHVNHPDYGTEIAAYITTNIWEGNVKFSTTKENGWVLSIHGNAVNEDDRMRVLDYSIRLNQKQDIVNARVSAKLKKLVV
jgi:hypothetical protein